MTPDKPLLTTLTPYKGRPEALRAWKKAVCGATRPWVQHMLIAPTTPGNDLSREELTGWHTLRILRPVVSPLEIFTLGKWHNYGAKLCTTQWMMKLDVDVLPHQAFFDHLLPVLQAAREREWFNVGMLYVNRAGSAAWLDEPALPLDVKVYNRIMDNRSAFSANRYLNPAGSQFVCQVSQYRRLGGTDSRFVGYGWEDYQVLYMLERDFLGSDPLPGGCVTFENVARRCRDEISRPMALRLWERDRMLCLLHRWHPSEPDVRYKANLDANRRVLLDYVSKHRRMAQQSA